MKMPKKVYQLIDDKETPIGDRRIVIKWGWSEDGETRIWGMRLNKRGGKGVWISIGTISEKEEKILSEFCGLKFDEHGCI